MDGAGPRPRARAGAILALQVFGSGLVVAHNYGWVFKSDEMGAAQALATEHRRRPIGLAFLPASIGQLHSGYLQNHMPETKFVFAREEAGQLRLNVEFLFRVMPVCAGEWRPDCMSPHGLRRWASTLPTAVYVDPSLAERLRAETGLTARP